MWGGTEIGVKIISSAFRSESDKETFYEVFSPISDYAFIENVKPIWAEFDEIRIPKTFGEEDYHTAHTKRNQICSYPLTNMLVHCNGDIGVCCHDWKHMTAYANVKETSLLAAWNSEELRDFRLKHLTGRRNEIPYCSTCLQNGYDNVDNDAAELVKKLESMR